MKAIEFRKCGPPEVLKLVENRQRPEPAAGELLVQVRAAGLNPRDFKVRKSNGMRLSFGISLPAVLGNDLAGEVVALGQGVTSFAVGDAVMAMLELRRPGAYAEYAVVPARLAARKPEQLDFTQAAALPLAGLTALQLLNRASPLGESQRVLINGASGGVGTFAVQIAKARGAIVTGITSTRNLEFVRSLGADSVVDYSVGESSLGGPYDLVVDTVGSLWFGRAKAVLAKSGAHVSCIPEPSVFLAAAFSRLGSRRSYAVIVKPSGEGLEELAQLIAIGKLRPAVERIYELSEGDVMEAHRHLETNRTRGKLVLRLA